MTDDKVTLYKRAQAVPQPNTFMSLFDGIDGGREKENAFLRIVQAVVSSGQDTVTLPDLSAELGERETAMAPGMTLKKVWGRSVSGAIKWLQEQGYIEVDGTEVSLTQAADEKLTEYVEFLRGNGFDVDASPAAYPTASAAPRQG